MATEGYTKRQALLAKLEKLYPSNVLVTPDQVNTIKGLAVGTTFNSRKELSDQGVHRPLHAGISSSSVVLSGRYEDDGDMGDVVIYTGTGGQIDSFHNPGPQVQDQSFTHRDNAALYKSFQAGRPIRLIRGSNSSSKYAPAEGYRYDGMYKVTNAYMEKGQSGYAVCRFRLERMPGQPPIQIQKRLF